MDLACNIARAGLRVVLVHTVDDKYACSCGRGDKCPIKTRGKHPLLTAWQKIATDDEQALRDQSARLKFEPNVGIALGPQSDGRYIISIDDDDSARMAELEAEHGSLPHTMSGQSPRGARLFFSLPSDTPLDRVKNVTGIGKKPGVDMKAAGGQVVVAGRNAGGEYSGLDITVPIAELPAAWTLAILAPIPLPKTAREYTPQTLREDAKAKRRHETYLDRAIGSECRMVARTGEGQRNTATYTAACRLLPLASGLHLATGISHVRDEVTRAGVAAGLSEKEARDTVASAERWVVDNGLVRVPREVPREVVTEKRLRVVTETDDVQPSVNLIEDNGAPAKIAENVARMLAVHPRGMPRLNQLANRVEWPDGAQVTDSDEVKIQGWLVSQPSSMRVRCGLDAVHSGVQTAAEERAFHPVREYLEGLKWDGQPRLETFAARCLGVVDSDLVHGYMRCFFIGAVARAMVPGCQLDTVLVLEGAQGARKTSALRMLFGRDWFRNTRINVSRAPDCYQALEGAWGYELGEVDSMLRREDVKDYISSSSDTYRPSYGRNTVTRPRQLAFVGTTNEDTYLMDATGARRWQCIKCTTVDLDAIGRERDQLWAEAAHRYAAGEPWWLSRELEAVAAEDVGDRFQNDPWEMQLHHKLLDQTVTTSAAALSVLGVEVAKQTRADEIRVGHALRRLGWSRRRVVRHGVRGYEYLKNPM